MSAPTWTILVPTIPRRAALFARLMDRLLPQLDLHCGRVVVVGWLNEGTPRLGELRDAMVDWADLQLGAEYVSFVDDDDLVPDYYVTTVLAALGHRPDHVGFQVDYWKNGERQGLIEHKLSHGRWGARVRRPTDPPGGKLVIFRDFTHIDPIRTSIARRGRFADAPPHAMEDRAWVRSVRPHLKTEVYIPRPMYTYFWTPAESAWDRPGAQLGSDAFTHLRPEYVSPYFTWHPESL